MKKIFGVLLMICLSFTLMPVGTYAEDKWIEVSTYDGLVEVVNKGEDAKIKVTKAFSSDSNESIIKINSNITIDLNNNQTITLGKIVLSSEESNLTISDNSTQKEGVLKIFEMEITNGKFTIENGKIELCGYFNMGYGSKNTKSVTMNGGILSMEEDAYISFVDCTFHANGGTIQNYKRLEPVKFMSDTDVITDSGATGTVFECSVENTSKGSVSAGIYKEGHYFLNVSDFNPTISGGTFYGEVKNDSYGRINGGTFTDTSVITNNGTINKGTFNGTIINNKTITGGTFTDISGNGSISGENVTVNGTITGGTLYGTIKGDYTISGNTVTYKTGNDTYARQVVQSGDAATKPITPSKDNYAFVGWFIDENCTTPYDFKNKVNDDITLYAGYSPATITFDTKGGTTVDPITQEYGTEITKPSNPTKKGYIFDGWDTTIPSTMPANNMTISAKWTECISHELVELVNDETLKEKATCSSKAIYYKSCKKCGYTSEETFEYGDYASHNNLIHIDRKEPTTEIEGNIEYYYCDTCKKCFSDIEGLNEISKESTVLNKITPSSNKVVTCEEYIHSKDWTWSESKKACVYKVSNTYAK